MMNRSFAVDLEQKGSPREEAIVCASVFALRKQMHVGGYTCSVSRAEMVRNETRCRNS